MFILSFCWRDQNTHKSTNLQIISVYILSFSKLLISLQTIQLTCLGHLLVFNRKKQFCYSELMYIFRILENIQLYERPVLVGTTKVNSLKFILHWISSVEV